MTAFCASCGAALFFEGRCQSCGWQPLPKPILPGADRWKPPLARALAAPTPIETEVILDDDDIIQLLDGDNEHAPQIATSASLSKPVDVSHLRKTLVPLQALVDVAAVEEHGAQSEVEVSPFAAPASPLTVTPQAASPQTAPRQAAAQALAPPSTSPAPPPSLSAPQDEAASLWQRFFAQAPEDSGRHEALAEPEEDHAAPSLDIDEDNEVTVVTAPPYFARAGEVVRAALAPVWRRLLAAALDAVPLFAAAALVLFFYERALDKVGLGFVPGNLEELSLFYWTLGRGVFFLLFAVVAAALLYHTLTMVYMQGSVGDLVVGVRWITKRGARPGWARALIRAALMIPSWAMALAGVLSAVLARSRRPFYDVATGVYPVLRASCEVSEREVAAPASAILPSGEWPLTSP